MIYHLSLLSLTKSPHLASWLLYISPLSSTFHPSNLSLSLSLIKFILFNMAVELMGFPKLDEQKAIQEAASEGLKGMEHLILTLSHQPTQLNTQLTDLTVSKFKKLISLLNRTGHARFRRAPVQPPPVQLQSTLSSSSLPPPPQPQTSTPKQFPSPPPSLSPPLAPTPISIRHAPSSFPQPQHHSLTLDFTKPNDVVLSSNAKNSIVELEFSKDTATFSVSSTSSFMSSAITGDGSVNGKQGSSIFLNPAATPAISGGKPPLSSAPSKKRCHDHGEHSDDVSGSNKCHCVKRRYYTTPYTFVTAFYSIITFFSWTSRFLFD